MAGNVWEWCWDYYSPYPAEERPDEGPLVNPTGPSMPSDPDTPWPGAPLGGAYRVLRGGAWNIQDPVWLRGSARSTDDETVRDPDIGFRIARGPVRRPKAPEGA